MKFKYLIFDQFYGGFYGSNDDQVALDCSVSDDHWVVELSTMENIHRTARTPVLEDAELNGE